jgi:hypothetical protein
MTTFLLTTLFLFTIAGAFAFGIAAGYWVICGFLSLFDPSRTGPKATHSPALAPTASGE